MNTPNDRPDWKAVTPSAPPAIHSQTLSRVVGLVRGFTGLAGVMSIVVLTGEATLPAPYKPSTLIGSFHGRIEAADAAAKVGPVTFLTRQNAEAAAQPPAFASMESSAFQQQQQVLADSMQSQSTIANGADVACIAGQLIPRDNRDWGWLGQMLSQGCGRGDQLRQGMLNTLKRGAQDNSVLIQRPRAGDNGGE